MNKNIFKISLKNIAIILLIAIFFIVDRYLKSAAIRNQNNSPVEILGNLFTFTFTPNYYIAFSLPLSGVILTVLIGLIILALTIFLGYLVKERQSKLLAAGLFLILLGAISNFIDRLSFGYVVDYLYLRYFTVFNLADMYISIGALISLISLKKDHKI